MDSRARADTGRAGRDGVTSDAIPWHALAVDEIAGRLGIAGDRGLTTDEAARRLAIHGPNTLAPPVPPSALTAWLRHLCEPVVATLLVAACLAALVGDLPDAAAIVAILLVNALIGFVQEDRAQRALESLRRLAAPRARVVRDGTSVVVPAALVVPGDRIEIVAGDILAADARLTEAHGLLVDESTLTGESVAAPKDAAAILPAATAPGDRVTVVHAGTTVLAGQGRAVVVATGMATAIGAIAGLLEGGAAESTPLQRRLAALGRTLVAACLGLVCLIAAIDIARGVSLTEVLPRAVSLAVATVPEGLPAVVTLILAVGVQRMSRRNVLVRRLPGVETLGTVTVICTDKTGTLTRNEMTVREIVTATSAFAVGGAGWDPHGDFVPAGGGGPITPSDDADLAALLRVAGRCPDFVVAPQRGGGPWRAGGDPTDAALVVAAMKGGQTADPDPVAWELPFDSSRRMASVVTQDGDGGLEVSVRGAPEAILARSVAELRRGVAVPLDAARREALSHAAEAMAARALRVVALARGTVGGPVAAARPAEEVERDLVLVGFAGINDPPREEVPAAVAACRSAGIRPLVITGDHPATARAIAREVGILPHGGAEWRCVQGEDLERMDDAALDAAVPGIAVYARMSPAQKLRVVESLRRVGEVVAMTGDGVNDSPALRAADIGIAMGRTGSDVTREAADMVLVDDSFSSIVGAVEEGRAIDDNVRKVVHYLLACNVGEMTVMFVAAVAGWPAPLSPLQILWLNLVTDGLPALSLGMEPPERDLLARPPRGRHAPILAPRAVGGILLQGMLVALVTLVAFRWHAPAATAPASVVQAQSQAFAVAAVAQLLVAIGCRSRGATAIELGFFRNRWLLAAIVVSALLQGATLAVPGAWDALRAFPPWGVVAGLAALPLALIELSKVAVRGSARAFGRRSLAGGADGG